MEEYYDNAYINVLYYCTRRGEVSEAEVQYECGLSYDTVHRCFKRMAAEKCVVAGEGDLYEVSVSTDALFEPAYVKKRMTELVKSLDEVSRTELGTRLGISDLNPRARSMWERFDRSAKAVAALKALYVLNDTGEGTELTLNEEERDLAREVLRDIRAYAGAYSRPESAEPFKSSASCANGSADNKNIDEDSDDDSDADDDEEYEFGDDHDGPDDEGEDDEYDVPDEDDECEFEDDPDENDECEFEDDLDEDEIDLFGDEESDDEDADSDDEDPYAYDSEYFEKQLERFKRELDEGKCDLFGSDDDDNDGLMSSLMNLLIRKRRKTMLKMFDENLAAAGSISDDCLQVKNRSEQISAEIRDILNNSDASRHTADSEETFLYKSLSDMTAIYKKLVSDIRETIERDKRGMWDADSEEFRLRQIYVSFGEEIIYIATRGMPAEEELKKEALSSGSADDYASRFADKVACMVLAYMNDYAYVRKGYKRFDDIFVYYKALYVLFNSAFVWGFSPEGKEAEESSELFKSLKVRISEATSRAGIDFYEDTFSHDGEKLKRFNSRVYRDIFRFTVEMFAEEAAKKVLIRLINDDGEDD